MDVRTVDVDTAEGRIPLALAEAGAGGRPLLLVHGFTGAKEDFTDWLDPLAERGWHAVAIDQRGHGDAHKPEEESAYTFEAYAADLLAVLDSLGWPSAVVLGHSMGGMVVQTAALAAPERFEALVLMDTSHRALAADRGMVELAIAIARAEGMQAVLVAQDAAAQSNPLTNEVAARLQAERPGYKEFGERKLLASSPAMYASMIDAITDVEAGVDRLPDLGSVRAPTLVIVGEHDDPFVKPSRRMAEAIPGATLAVIPGGAHSPQFEAPDAWWAALTGFLDAL